MKTPCKVWSWMQARWNGGMVNRVFGRRAWKYQLPECPWCGSVFSYGHKGACK